jgi:hypothetical protein
MSDTLYIHLENVSEVIKDPEVLISQRNLFLLTSPNGFLRLSHYSDARQLSCIETGSRAMNDIRNNKQTEILLSFSLLFRPIEVS